MEQEAKQVFLKEILEKLESYHVEKLQILSDHITCILDGKACTYTWESSLFTFLQPFLSTIPSFLCFSIKSQGVHSFHIEFTLEKRYRLTIDILSTSICFSLSLKKDSIRYISLSFNDLHKQPLFSTLIHGAERYFLHHPSYRVRLASGALSFSYSKEILTIIQK